MNLPRSHRGLRIASLAPFARLIALATSVLALASCAGGGGSSSTSTTDNSTRSPVNNSLPIQVGIQAPYGYVNGLYASVTLCVPGTSNCQTIPNVLVDTGSEGLRILETQLSLSLPAEKDLSGNALQECVSFADMSYVWGPVATADIQLAGEKATSVPIHIISANPALPAPCATSGGPGDANTTNALGATGILGVGNFRQDCGGACTAAANNPGLYYLCPNGVCRVANVPLPSQLQNPVWVFAQDNNGLLVSLPPVGPNGETSVPGSLIFGIGTQSNNSLGSAKIFTADASTGNFTTTYNGNQYPDSFIDSGSNAIYFLSSSILGANFPDCPDAKGFYCPSQTQALAAINTGVNGTTGQVQFSIANAEKLFATNNAAFNNLGGDNPGGGFDWGMSFFFGRNVFVGIEGQPAPNNGPVGPYWAY